jgi:hypothetical protein
VLMVEVDEDLPQQTGIEIMDLPAMQAFSL